jgi:hypothetical protein
LGARTLAQTQPSLLILADALQVDGTLGSVGYALLHRVPHLCVAQGSFEVQPLLHVVVLQERVRSARFLCRSSAGCKRSIRYHITIRSQSVTVIKLIETDTTACASCKSHCQSSRSTLPSPPLPHLNSEACTATTTPPRASRCMTTHLNSFPTSCLSTLIRPLPFALCVVLQRK